jgi:FtsH-binding integral membrane protein
MLPFGNRPFRKIIVVTFRHLAREEQRKSNDRQEKDSQRMNNQKKRRKHRSSQQRNANNRHASPQAAEESRSTVAATVFWMLATMICLASQVAALAAFSIRRMYQMAVMDSVFAVAMMIAAITGITALMTALAVCRLSRLRPPSAILWPAIAVSTLPVAYVLLRL